MPWLSTVQVQLICSAVGNNGAKLQGLPMRSEAIVLESSEKPSKTSLWALC
jgi:hypothetical protein